MVWVSIPYIGTLYISCQSENEGLFLGDLYNEGYTKLEFIMRYSLSSSAGGRDYVGDYYKAHYGAYQKFRLWLIYSMESTGLPLRNLVYVTILGQPYYLLTPEP